MFASVDCLVFGGDKPQPKMRLRSLAFCVGIDMNTVEIPVSADHPKWQAKVVAYGRWWLTRV